MKTIFDKSFKNAKRFDNFAWVLLIVSSVLTTVEVCLNKFKCNSYVFYIVIINCFSIFLFQVATIYKEYILFKAEELKRMDLFDNSFGTKIAETRTEGYYSNDNIEFGLKKLCINNFESCFFTYRIMKSDLEWSIIKIIVFVFIFIFVALFGIQNIVILLIQATLPMTVFFESLRYCVTYKRVEHIYRDFRYLFDDYNSMRDVDALRLVVNYTATLTSGNLLLSNKTYNKMNKKLSKEWEKIKIDFNIA